VGSLEQAKKSKAPKSPCGGCGKEFKLETLKNGAGYCARCLAKGKPSASSSKSTKTTKSKKPASHASGGGEEQASDPEDD